MVNEEYRLDKKILGILMQLQDEAAIDKAYEEFGDKLAYTEMVGVKTAFHEKGYSDEDVDKFVELFAEDVNNMIESDEDDLSQSNFDVMAGQPEDKKRIFAEMNEYMNTNDFQDGVNKFVQSLFKSTYEKYQGNLTDADIDALNAYLDEQDANDNAGRKQILNSFYEAYKTNPSEEMRKALEEAGVNMEELMSGAGDAAPIVTPEVVVSSNNEVATQAQVAQPSLPQPDSEMFIEAPEQEATSAIVSESPIVEAPVITEEIAPVVTPELTSQVDTLNPSLAGAVAPVMPVTDNTQVASSVPEDQPTAPSVNLTTNGYQANTPVEPIDQYP
jgi:hypothetical protein